MAEDKNYIKKDGIIYAKLTDGRQWCPSGQARGIRYTIKEDKFPSEFNLSPNFVAIDFETVLQNKTHYPCQLGIVVVKDCKIVEEMNYLIQPPGNKFDSQTMRVHHITPEMTADKPEFPEIWEDIKEYFTDCFLVAHNLRFDGSVLYNALTKYNIERPVIRNYACTMIMNNHQSLDEVCEMYDVTLENHHDGLADAKACAEIFIAMNNGKKAKKVARKKKAKAEKSGPIQQDLFETHIPLRGDILQKDLTGADPDNPFYDRKVVITGLFDIERQALASRLKKMGADIDSTVTKRTNFVLVGKEPGWAKMEKVDKLNMNGFNIRKLHQEDIDRIFAGEWEDYLVGKENKKELNLTYEHLSSPEFHIPVTAWNINPFVNKEFYCGKGMSGNSDFIAQMFGNVGAYCSPRIDKDIEACIISDSTAEALKNGEKDETIIYIQDTYNAMKSQAFDYKFVIESEFLDWIKKRTQNTGDSVTAKLIAAYEGLGTNSDTSNS